MHGRLVATLCEREDHSLIRVHTIEWPVDAGGAAMTGMDGMENEGPSIKVMFQDLTRAGGHDPKRTRIYHIMFHGDPDLVAEFVVKVNRDFRGFYEKVRSAVSTDGKPNPLDLPPFRDSEEMVIKGAQPMMATDPVPAPPPPCEAPNCPCNLLGLTLTPDGEIFTSGMVALCHASPCPAQPM